MVNKKRKLWFWMLSLFVITLICLKIFSGKDEKIDANRVAIVKRGELRLEVTDTGKIEAKERVEIKSKISGQVLDVLVDEGQSVTKGQLLIRLDPIEMKRELARADAEVFKAQSGVEYARLNLTRKKTALAEHGASQADVDLAQSELKSQEAILKTTLVALQTARDRLSYTEIVSPIDGTITERHIEPGEVVVPGIQATYESQPLLAVANLKNLVVKTELNQIDVVKLKMGQQVRLTLDAIPELSLEAQVSKIAPAGIIPKDKKVEIFPVEASLNGEHEGVRPGMTADVHFLLESKQNTLSLPIEAIAEHDGKSYVKRIQDAPKNTKELETEVTLGTRTDREVEIISGLGEGDRVQIDPGPTGTNEAKL